MRKALPILATLVAVAIALYLAFREPPVKTGMVNPAASTSEARPNVVDANGTPLLPPTGSSPTAAVLPNPAVSASRSAASSPSRVVPPTASTIGVPASSPSKETGVVDAGKALRMVHDYHTLMGENPIGTNAEIMKSLMGGNPHEATLGPLEGQGLNEKGELVDQWGTPYFFHQLSRDVMEIHSAGPDKVMGTPDDIVVK